MIEVQSNRPYEVSDHYPVVETLNIDLLSSMPDNYKFKKLMLKWKRADEFKKNMYRTEIDKLLNFSI